ncbi:hypothetical protein BOX15_Mlig027057g1, partial [Macrostomum lignano]
VMPGRVRVKILSARNLPVMDRASYSTDAFVELKLGNASYKTEVARRSLNPQWNTEWFKFELDDEELQDEALQIRVLDYDTYSSHDAIGKVYIDLNPLLGKDGSRGMSGWFPLYDTMHGIRGDIQISVNLDLFSDTNRYRESSLGVKFFYHPGVPVGQTLLQLLGFVEELVVNDDPEYQWIEKLRTSRASNEARQRLFSRLNGQLQRKLGLRVLGMGGNAVIGYRLHFDLEGESGIVVRGIGTAVSLTASKSAAHLATETSLTVQSSLSVAAAPAAEPAGDSAATNGTLEQQSAVQQQQSADVADAGPGFNKLLVVATSASESANLRPLASLMTAGAPSAAAECDTPFVTMSCLPTGLVASLGGTVAAKSVKLLVHSPDAPDARDAWWSEIRSEVRAHARAFGCSTVIGYNEETCIADDLIVLSAYGTAAKLNSLEDVQNSQQPPSSCRALHVLYSQSSPPFPVSFSRCAVCGRGSVPDILLATSDTPAELATCGQPALIQARVWRPKRDAKGEANAREVSDRLPFIEYELHSQLVQKLRLRGMNGLFGLRTRMSVASCGILVTATGTGVHLLALPAPCEPQLVSKGDQRLLSSLQAKVSEFVSRSREVHGLDRAQALAAISASSGASVSNASASNSDSGGAAEDAEASPPIDLQSNQRDNFIISLADDCETDEMEALLVDYPLMDSLQLTCSPACRSEDTNFFVRILRCPLDDPEANSSRQVNSLLADMLHSTCFHFRHSLPCTLAALHFHTEVTDESCLQTVLTGDCVRQTAPQGGLLLGTASGVLLCSGCHPPGRSVANYLGNLDFFFIRETSSVRDCGGSQAFLHTCLAEVMAVVRAHAAALGGQAVTSFHLSEVLLLDNPSRGHAQCLLNVCGDVVQLPVAEA